MAKDVYKFEKELINGKWYSVCKNQEHVPMIEHTRDGKYKVRNSNGKAILHDNFGDAKKLAIDVYRKFAKFNKTWKED